jgi:hypothetical protein
MSLSRGPNYSLDSARARVVAAEMVVMQLSVLVEELPGKGDDN